MRSSRSANDTAAQYDITVIDNTGLARRRCPLGFVKADLYSPFGIIQDRARLLSVPVTDLCRSTLSLLRRKTRDPVETIYLNFFRKQVLILTEDDAICFGIDTLYIQRDLRRKSQPLCCPTV